MNPDIVEVCDGTEVVVLAAHEDLDYLRIREPVHSDWEPYYNGGAVSLFASWSKDRQLLREVAAVNRWLAEPDDTRTGEAVRPLLRLLGNGRYRLERCLLPSAYLDGWKGRYPSARGLNRREQFVAPSTGWGHRYLWPTPVREGPCLTPAMHWHAGQDEITDHYRDRIRVGRRPLVVLLARWPFDSGKDLESVFLIDGHRKFAAYTSLGVSPHCVLVTPIQTHPPRVGPPAWVTALMTGDQDSDGTTTVEVTGGIGIVDLVGYAGFSCLRIWGDPYVCEAYTASGTCDRLAVLAGDAGLRREMRALTGELALPRDGIPREALRPLLDMMPGGRYRIGRVELAYSPLLLAHEGTKVPNGRFYSVSGNLVHWYDGDPIGPEGPFLVPTQRWPPPADRTVSHYKTMIRTGQRPLAVLLAPPDSGRGLGFDIAYVLDGHHKLAAYADQGVAPHCLVIKPREISPMTATDLGALASASPESALQLGTIRDSYLRGR